MPLGTLQETGGQALDTQGVGACAVLGEPFQPFGRPAGGPTPWLWCVTGRSRATRCRQLQAVPSSGRPSVPRHPYQDLWHWESRRVINCFSLHSSSWSPNRAIWIKVAKNGEENWRLHCGCAGREETVMAPWEPLFPLVSARKAFYVHPSPGKTALFALYLLTCPHMNFSEFFHS